MDWTNILVEWMHNYGYFAVVGILVLCGIGLPIPEELTFILAGYTVHLVNHTEHMRGLNLKVMIACAMLGLLMGDSLLFMLGKYYGQSLLKRWPFKMFFTPKRMEESIEFFHKYGHWTILMAGFVAGVRACTYFLAASMGVKYRRFIVLDICRALVTCPVSIWLGWKFGFHAEHIIHEYSLPVMIAVLLLAIYFGLRWYIRKNKVPVEPTVTKLAEVPMLAKPAEPAKPSEPLETSKLIEPAKPPESK